MAIKEYLHFYFCDEHDWGFVENNSDIYCNPPAANENQCCNFTNFIYYGAIRASDGMPCAMSPDFRRITALNLGGWRSAYFLDEIYDEDGMHLDIQLPQAVIDIVDQ